jgi:2-haloacid dehalogenase
LLYSEVATLADLYVPFSAIAGAALEMLARSRGFSIVPDDRDRILNEILSLPPHHDVCEGLQRLRDAGLRLVAFTNSTPQTVQQQFMHARLTAFFERVFSVDSVRRFKPAPEPYRFVAKELGVETSDLRMVAAHGWDIVGAMQAGCAAAFVMRPGQTLYPLAPPPDIIARDVRELTTKIIEAELRYG